MRPTEVPLCKVEEGTRSQGHAQASLNFVTFAPHLHYSLDLAQGQEEGGERKWKHFTLAEKLKLEFVPS